MFVFIPGSILPVRFGQGEMDSPDGSISPVTSIYLSGSFNGSLSLTQVLDVGSIFIKHVGNSLCGLFTG